MSTLLAQESAPNQTLDSSPNQIPEQAPRPSVMIIEDESIISLDIKNSLLALGYDVAGVAASGSAALIKIATKRPDLILMDIHLKGQMTGIEIAEKVQTDFQIPVIYLTANADSATFQKAVKTSPYGYLLKPFGEKELGMAIEIALHKHRESQIVKASEHWYATAFQSLQESVIATDANGCIIFMNAFAEETTGYSLARVIDQPLVEVLTFQQATQPWTSDEPFENMDSILDAVLSGRSVQPLPDQLQLVTQSSAQVAIEGDVAALRETSGRIIGSILKFREYQEKADKQSVQFSTDVLAEPVAQPKAQPKETAAETIKNKYNTKDIELVKAFVHAFINKEMVFLSSSNLVASSGDSVTTLSARSEGLVVKVTSVEGILTAAVQQSSEYWELIRQILIENHFFPVSLRTNGFCRYQHLEVPKNFQVYHTSGVELCDAWSDAPSYSKAGKTGPARENIVVLRRDKWCHIQRLVMEKERLCIKTVSGDLLVPMDDSLVWGVNS